MKAFYLKSLFAAALAVTLSSCEKKAENIEHLSEKNTSSISKVVYPLLGNGMSTSIRSNKDNLPDAVFTIGEFTKKTDVKIIDLVCEEYLAQTKKLDLSHMQEGKFQEQVVNDDLEVKFRDPNDFRGEGFKKLSSGPKGWWTHWNYSPYTESEYPNVLFAEDKNGNVISHFILNLSDQVTIFGFEVAPNTIGEDVNVGVTYYLENHYRSLTMGNLRQTISSPSGARLIAIKSKIPFARVSIFVGGSSEGVAISNIRYALK